MSIPEQEYEFLMFYMKETWEEMRHTEQLRATVSSLIMTLAALVGGFIVQQKFTKGTLILSIFLILLGLFGAIMVRKLYQLHQGDQARLNQWYAYLQEKMPEAEVIKRRDLGDRVHKDDFFLMSKIPHNYFWMAFHLLIALEGVVMLLLIIT